MKLLRKAVVSISLLLFLDFFMLRQCYEGGTALKHPCEGVQAKITAEEISRLYLSTGAVMKQMRNGKWRYNVFKFTFLNCSQLQIW